MNSEGEMKIYNVVSKASQPMQLDRIVYSKQERDELIAYRKKTYPTIAVEWVEIHEG